MALRIGVFARNHKGAGADKSLKARRGLSLLSDESTSILFDTGLMAVYAKRVGDGDRPVRWRPAVWCFRMVITIIAAGVPWLPDNSQIIAIPIIARERYAAMTFLGITRKIKLSREGGLFTLPNDVHA